MSQFRQKCLDAVTFSNIWYVSKPEHEFLLLLRNSFQAASNAHRIPPRAISITIPSSENPGNLVSGCFYLRSVGVVFKYHTNPNHVSEKMKFKVH